MERVQQVRCERDPSLDPQMVWASSVPCEMRLVQVVGKIWPVYGYVAPTDQRWFDFHCARGQAG